jgi:hypothetical protein
MKSNANCLWSRTKRTWITSITRVSFERAAASSKFDYSANCRDTRLGLSHSLLFHSNPEAKTTHAETSRREHGRSGSCVRSFCAWSGPCLNTLRVQTTFDPPLNNELVHPPPPVIIFYHNTLSTPRRIEPSQICERIWQKIVLAGFFCSSFFPCVVPKCSLGGLARSRS